jgi:hypothetical protein
MLPQVGTILVPHNVFFVCGGRTDGVHGATALALDSRRGSGALRLLRGEQPRGSQHGARLRVGGRRAVGLRAKQHLRDGVAWRMHDDAACRTTHDELRK